MFDRNKLSLISELTTPSLQAFQAELEVEIETAKSSMSIDKIGALAEMTSGLDRCRAELASRQELSVQPEPVVEAAPVVEPIVASAPDISPVGLSNVGIDNADAPQPATIVASADIPGIVAGSVFNNLRDVAEAFMRKRDVFRGSSSMANGDHAIVATIKGVYPEERILAAKSLEENMNKVQSVVSPNALVASGGACGPVEPYYDLQVLAEACRPVRDALARFQADRSGIIFMPPPRLSDVASTAITTMTNAQDVQNQVDLLVPQTISHPKTCLKVTCSANTTVLLTAISRCLTFGNLAARSYPEQVEAWLQLATAQHARVAEQLLLDGLASNSTAVTQAATYGASRTLIPALDTAIAGYKSRNRICGGVKLRLMLPEWSKGLLRADLARTWNPTMSVTDGEIEGWFTARGVNVTFYMDSPTNGSQVFGAQSAGAMTTFPSTVVFFLFVEGSFLFLDGGTLDLGLVRDSTLNATNDYQIFAETFENIAFVGVESIKGTVTVCANGAYPLGSSAVACPV